MDLRGRLHLDRAAWPLAVGDLITLTLVFTAGAVRHYGTAYPLAQPGDWALTVAPFLIGWIVVAPLVGAYSAGAAESAKAAIPLALRAWLPALVLALLVRVVALDGGLQPVFVGVTLVSGALGLVLWRWLRFRLQR